MIDVGSPLLDVVIALAFVFFLLSIICSALMESVAALLKLRAKALEKSIRSLLAGDTDSTTAAAVLDHPLVQSAGTEGAPSYVTPRNFALALLDTLAPPPAGQAGSRDVVAAVRSQTETLPEPLQRQIEPILDEAQEDIADLRAGIENWFDSSQDRVSGWYKRRTQSIILGIAIVVTIALNVSTFRVVDRLWNDSTVRSSVVAAATAAVEEEASSTTDPEPDATGAAEVDPINEAQAAGEKARVATGDLAALNLPIGWGDDNQNWFSALNLVGWAVTVIAIWLGAPFWFQLLSRLAPLRSTGPKPETSDSG